MKVLSAGFLERESSKIGELTIMLHQKGMRKSTSVSFTFHISTERDLPSEFLEMIFQSELNDCSNKVLPVGDKNTVALRSVSRVTEQALES